MRNSADDLRPQIQRLVALAESIDERLARLEASHGRHGQQLGRQNDQVSRVEDAQTKLAEVLTRQAELLARLEEAQVRHAEQLGHLEETSSRQIKQLTRLEEEQCRQGKQLTDVEDSQDVLTRHLSGSDADASAPRYGQLTPSSRLAARRQARAHANGSGQRSHADGLGEAGSLARRELRREARRAARRSNGTDYAAAHQESQELDQVQGEVRQIGDRLNRLLNRLDRIGRDDGR